MAKFEAATLTRDELWSQLEKEIHGKSVYETLMKIRAGKVKNKWEHAKGISSLMTHVAVAMEQGRTEYHGLFLELYEALGKLVF